MERLLARLERSFLGRIAIPNLPLIIVGGMAFVFVLLYTRHDLVDYLTLDPALALRQPWRFVTFLFIPRYGGLFWVFFSLYWTWLVGSNLEQEWGAFRLTLYYVLGAIGTAAAAWITGLPQGNIWLNTSLFFAFATLFPDYEILLFFMVPIRVKWLVVPTVALLGWIMVDGDMGSRAAIAVAFSNYFLFFGGHLLAIAQGKRLQIKQAARRTAFRAPVRRDDRRDHDDDSDDKDERDEKAAREDRYRPVVDSRPSDAVADKRCAICGAAQVDGADIRVCTCAKCVSPRQLCLEHARNH